MVQLSFNPTRFTKLQLFLLGLSILIALVVASLISRPTLDANNRIDLGKLDIDTVQKTSFSLRNRGFFTLSIQPTSCSCGSTFSSNKSTMIRCGDSMDMEVTFHLFRHTLGPFKKEYRIITNDLFRPFVVFEVRGEVVSPATFTE
jgi:hypothetical protein